MTQNPKQDHVLIFDTTLRDGEQSPGATMNHDEKLEIAELLDEMGVDIIEAGFPIASEGDFKAVSEIAERSKNAVICGLARANFKDIDRCWEAVKHARQPRIHTFIGTSPLHREITALDQDEMIARIHDTVSRARNLCDNVQWSPMDATRTEDDYLCRTVETAIKAGATTINIPDTVGYTAPRESADLIRMLINQVPGADKVIFTRSNSPKAVFPSDLAEMYTELCGKMCQTTFSLKEAIRMASSAVSKEDLICVAGSFYLVGQAKELFHPKPTK